MTRLLIAIVLLCGPAVAMALQDPTQPPVQQVTRQPAAEQRQFTLASILYGPERKVAVINGVPRSEGETFEGVRLRRIYPGRVELVVKGQVREVRLASPPVIRTSK